MAAMPFLCRGVWFLPKLWFDSFLNGRTQQVKIGRTLSSKSLLCSGVPQGGILSPIIFVIYGADMEQWLKRSSAFTYADDTSSSVTGKTIEEVKRAANLKTIQNAH